MQSQYDLYLEKCNNYCYENFYGEFSFFKREALFATYFLPLLDLSCYPISHKAIQKQLENIKDDYNTYSQKAEELYRETFFNGDFSFSLLQSQEDRNIIDLVRYCFISEYEENDFVEKCSSCIAFDDYLLYICQLFKGINYDFAGNKAIIFEIL